MYCASLPEFSAPSSLGFRFLSGQLGSIIIALNGPKEQTVGQIREFQKLFLAPGFLAFTGLLIAASLIIIFYFTPK